LGYAAIKMEPDGGVAPLGSTPPFCACGFEDH